MIFSVQFPGIAVELDVVPNEASNASTFCSELEFPMIDDNSLNDFVRIGRTSPTLKRSFHYDGFEKTNGTAVVGKAYSIPNESTFYGEPSSNIQNGIVSTTRELMLELAELAEKKRRLTPSVSDLHLKATTMTFTR